MKQRLEHQGSERVAAVVNSKLETGLAVDGDLFTARSIKVA